MKSLRWHLPPHLVMLGVMVFAMAPGAGALGHLVGGLALAVVALALAPFARRRTELHGVLLDLGAMTVILVATAMGGPDGGTHAHGPATIVVAGLTVVGWLIARIACTRDRVSAATGAASAIQLALMLALAV